jgi:hypothetical protein
MRALISVDLKSEDGSFPPDAALRGYFSRLGLRDTNTPNKDEKENEAAYELRLKQFYQNRAEKILARVPEHTKEQQEKKQFEREALVYTAYLTSSDTDLMVTRRSDGGFLLRLLNSRLGKLFDGAANMVLLLNDSRVSFQRPDTRPVSGSTPELLRLVCQPEIEVYEHGLEEPTITGLIVQNKWRYIRENESRDLLIAGFTFLLFLALVVLNMYIDSESAYHSAIERIETAMITTGMVALLSIIHAYFRLVPVVQWSLDPKAVKKGRSSRSLANRG